MSSIINHSLLQFLSPIIPYVEKESIAKFTLIQRCAGHVEYRILQTLKQLAFFEISKDEKGNLVFN